MSRRGLCDRDGTARPPTVDAAGSDVLGGLAARRGHQHRARLCRREPRAAGGRSGADSGARLLPVVGAARDRLSHRGVGTRSAVPLRADRPEDRGRTGGLSKPRRRDHQDPGLRLRRVVVRVRAARQPGGVAEDRDRRARARGQPVREHLRVHGAADDHLHRRAVRDALLLRHHADRRADVRGDHAPLHAGERRRVAERRRQHLHGSDGGAADHPAVSCRG